MAVATVNASFVTPEEWRRTAGGMMHLVAHAALLQYAKTSNTSLSEAARECFAVPPEWSTMDVLVAVRVLKPLFAWSGTPKTVRLKDRSGRYGQRWEPDRAMTQLYIPGLDPKKGRCLPWREALSGGPRVLSAL